MATTVLPPSLLQPRENRDLQARLAASSAVDDGLHTMKQFGEWFAEQKQTQRLETQRIPFAGLEGWGFAKETGNLTHASGGRYSVEGMRVLAWTGPICEWYQPVVKHPGIGLHGLLVKEFGGVLHCLVRAYAEPGHPEAPQLFPTAQAARGDYATAHRDLPIPYLDYFVGPRRGQVVTDSLQSSHGEWFYRMSNRHMIVEVTDDVPAHDGFFWLTVGQLNHLITRDRLLSAGLRSLLAFLPPSAGTGSARDRFKSSLHASSNPEAGALQPTSSLLSWLTEHRCYREVEVMPVALSQVAGWHRTDMEIARADGRYFSVMAMTANVPNATWSQPMVELRGTGLAAFVVKEFDGVLHLLVRAGMESGLRDTIEIGPTVQCQPKEFDRTPDASRPPLLDYVLGLDRSRVRYDAIQVADSAGIFHADGRYLIVEADDHLPDELPPEYTWAALGQLAGVARRSHCVNVPARTLIACINALH